VVRCAEDIEKMTRLVERLQSKIFKRQVKVVMGLGATMHKPMEIHDSNKEDKKEGVGVVQIFLKL
jgi:hypothetical protein